jgi:N12 class adenine-specific DNA methylase
VNDLDGQQLKISGISARYSSAWVPHAAATAFLGEHSDQGQLASFP